MYKSKFTKIILAFLISSSGLNARASSNPPTVLLISPANGTTDVASNKKLEVTFNKPINHLKINRDTFILTKKDGTKHIRGKMVYSRKLHKVVFSPRELLAENTQYIVRIKGGHKSRPNIQDMQGNLMRSDFVCSFKTAPNASTSSVPSTSLPKVSSTVPLNGSADVSMNSKVIASFSESINSNTAKFSLAQGGTLVTGALSYFDKTLVFVPAANFLSNDTYTATITTQVKDTLGNLLSNDYVWSFRTTNNIDETKPTVDLVSPVNGATGLALNTSLSAGFSETLDPATVNSTTVMLKQGAALIPVTVTYSGTSLTFKPTANLEYNSLYTATIKSQVKDLAANTLAKDYVWSFTTGANPDRTLPIVELVNPLNSATAIAINSSFNATFSEAVDPLTISSTSFLLQQGLVPVPGTVTYSGRTATFTPTTNLAYSSKYTGTITSQVKDLATNRLANDYVWSFITVPNPDTVPPLVQVVAPLNGATAIVTSSNLSVAFSEAVDTSTINSGSFVLKQGSTVVPGAVTYSGTTATFTPTVNLVANTIYTARITTQVRDIAGNLLPSDYVWSFTTVFIPDTTPPLVQIVNPSNDSTGIAINRTLTASFSEALDPLTVGSLTFLLKQGSTVVPGAVSYVGTTATFTPTVNLAYNSTYTATLTKTIKDVAGNPLINDYSWNFTTGAILNQYEPVVLASSSNYLILAGSTVTNTGPTIVAGNLGLSPGSAVTGFPPGSVTGLQDIGNPASAQAKLDLTTAYNNAAGRTLAPVTVSGNIGGQTLAPGLYKSTSTLAISSGDLTLDAKGNADAVFIFQIASAFTVTSGRQVILSGGAKAANVFWQVGSSATFGTTSSFKGNILADQSISFATGATLEGRALTRIGAVSLDSNTITRP